MRWVEKVATHRATERVLIALITIGFLAAIGVAGWVEGGAQ